MPKTGFAQYEGFFVRGQRHGFGVHVATNGDWYEGEFRYDQFDGAGERSEIARRHADRAFSCDARRVRVLLSAVPFGGPLPGYASISQDTKAQQLALGEELFLDYGKEGREYAMGRKRKRIDTLATGEETVATEHVIPRWERPDKATRARLLDASSMSTSDVVEHDRGAQLAFALTLARDAYHTEHPTALWDDENPEFLHQSPLKSFHLLVLRERQLHRRRRVRSWTGPHPTFPAGVNDLWDQANHLVREARRLKHTFHFHPLSVPPSKVDLPQFSLLLSWISGAQHVQAAAHVEGCPISRILPDSSVDHTRL